MSSKLHELFMLLKNFAGIGPLLGTHFTRNHAQQLGV
jgi:hypothetical protein